MPAVVAQGCEEATRYRDAICGPITHSQIEEAQRLAREWMKAH